MDDSGWQRLFDDVDAAFGRARAIAAQPATGSVELAAARSLLTRLPEFRRDLSIGRSRGRPEIALYRSIFEQLVTTLRRDG